MRQPLFLFCRKSMSGRAYAGRMRPAVRYLPDFPEFRRCHTNPFAKGTGEMRDTVEPALFCNLLYRKGRSGQPLLGFTQPVVQQVIMGRAVQFPAKASNQMRLTDHAKLRHAVQIDFLSEMAGNIIQSRQD